MGMVVGIVIALGVGFAGGTVYGKKSLVAGSPGGGFGANLTAEERQARATQFGSARGQGRGTPAGGGAGFASGEVLSTDTKSMTIKMRDGGSKIIFLADSTQIMKSSAGVVGDVRVGSEVTVMGTAGTDGTITAQSIQIRPATSTLR